MLYAIRCLPGAIHAVISGVSTNGLSSGSRSITSVGMIARYAASPVARGALDLPVTAACNILLTPSAPTMRSPRTTSPEASVTLGPPTALAGSGSTPMTVAPSRRVTLGAARARRSSMAW